MSLVDGAIGIAMRLYRRSALYPRAGGVLAKLLARRPGGPSESVKSIRGVTFHLDLSDTIGASLYYSGTFEAKTERLIESTLKQGDVAIDVGANFGYHTFRLAQGVGTAGQVLAIEPMSEAWLRLRVNAGLNNFPQVRYLQAALSDVDEGHAAVAFKSHYDVDGSEHTQPEVVRVTTLDSLVAEQGLQRVDFVKVDVDGYEGKVLRGAQETLKRWHPQILFEISPTAMATHGDEAVALLQLLAKLGYALFDEDRRPITDSLRLLQSAGNYSVNVLAARSH